MSSQRFPDRPAGPAGTGESLLRSLPPVLRARDFHLYTQSRGKETGRLTDLWQNGGGAILGHRPPALFRDFKNAASRGLWCPLPHPLENRLHKALARIFPRRVFRVYGPGTSPAAVWAAAGLPPPGAMADPAMEPYPADPGRPGSAAGQHAGSAGPALWRPFLDETAPLAVPEIPVLVPLLPGLAWGRSAGPLILAIDPAFAPAHPVPPSDLVSPALLAVLTRGIYDLAAAGPERGKCPFPEIRAAAARGPWERRGIYLRRRESPDPAAWAGIFRRFLAGGFLIPPEPDQPLILPGILSPGEAAKLAALLAEPAEGGL